MKTHLVITIVILSFLAPLSAAEKIVFKKVDVFVTQGDDEKKRDARLELYPDKQELTLVDEKNGGSKATYAVIPYNKITKIVYERASHRRYKSAIFVSPWLLFTKGKKHWMTIEFQDVPEYPQGFVYARLDKDNYRRILIALSAGTGLEIEKLVEE